MTKHLDEQIYWSEKEVAAFRSMNDSDMLDKEISEALGRTVTALRKARIRYGLRSRRRFDEWPEELISKAIQLFQNGVSSGKAAGILGKSRSAVAGKWRRLGLKRNDGNPAVVKRIRQVADARRRETMRLPPKPKIKANNVADVGSGISATVGRPLAALDNHQCRYSVASNGISHLMCGAPGHPWCQDHYMIVYRDSAI